MEKTVYLSDGINNGGVNEGMSIEKFDRTKYYFSPNLGDIFKRDLSYIFTMILNHHPDKTKKISKNKEYDEWCKKVRDPKTEIVDSHQALDKWYELLGPEAKSQTEESIEKLKQGPIKYIQDLTTNSFSEGIISKEKNLCSLKIENGKAVLDGEYLLHNMPIAEDVREYSGRKELGILATEWFGKFESREEGRFCSFFFNRKDIQPKHRAGQEFANNPTVKKLKENDFFEYVRNKDDSEYLAKLSEEQVKMFRFIESFSRKGKTAANENPDWVAIPGGVPPQFVVGIMVPDTIYAPKTQTSVDKITEAFASALGKPVPNRNITPEKAMDMAKQVAELWGVPLIDTQLKVLYNPNEKLQNNTQEQSTQSKETAREKC